jgi:hypothetical protein
MFGECSSLKHVKAYFVNDDDLNTYNWLSGVNTEEGEFECY